jgi:hypothetical protein
MLINKFEKSGKNQEVLAIAKSHKEQGVMISLQEVLKVMEVDHLDKGDYDSLKEICGTDLPSIKQAVKGQRKNDKLFEQLKGIPQNEYEFVNMQLVAWNTEMTFQEMFHIDTPYVYMGSTIFQADLAERSEIDQIEIKGADPKDLTSKAMLARLVKQNSLLELGYSDKQIDHALEDWKYTNKNMHIGGIKREIAFRPAVAEEAEDWWNVFVESITAVNVAETKAVLKHFIWQVKRKMFKLDVDYHLMPILMGDQSIGKSSLVRKFYGPVQDFTASSDFAKLTDDRDHGLWDNFVIFLDEMDKADKTDIGTIKRKITEPYFRSRNMNTNGGTNIIQNATFIGCQNRDLASTITDSTGMRRFYQIDCLSKFDWIINNSIPFDMLWQSIDQNKSSPLMDDADLFKRVKGIQEQKRRPSIVEMFLRDREYPHTIQRIQATPFFKEFQEYEEEHMPKKLFNATSFGIEVVGEAKKVDGLTIEKTKCNGKVYYVIEKIKGIDEDSRE